MNILLVEDNVATAEALKHALTEESFHVVWLEDGVDGLQQAKLGEFDLVLLDINLPKLDGINLLKTLRETRSDVPVIMVTARSSLEDRITGLDAGADDYLIKPFSFEELLARIRAVMRRPGARTDPISRYGELILDPSKGQVTFGEDRIHLSAREFSLLRVFMTQPETVLSRDQIQELVWHSKYDGRSNVVDVYINYLRNKLEIKGRPRYVHTVRGQGYIFTRKTTTELPEN
ncbi:MAG: response regulator transcription factor [Pirellulaceae bacterium]